MALKSANFSFSQFFFSILEDFSEKTYEKTCRFYNIFPKYNSNCVCLPSFTLWIFFSKICWPFQFNVHFLRFAPLLRENLLKDLPVLWLIFKLPIIMCTLKKFCRLKVFTKKMAVFQNVDNLLFISATLSNICDKTCEKTYHFFKYFETSTSFLHVYKISWSANLKTKNALCFNMWTKPCSFQQLWTIFSTKIMKNPTIFVTYFWSLFQFVHCHALLLWPHFYNKNDGRFNVVNKLLFISKGIFCTICF